MEFVILGLSLKYGLLLINFKQTSAQINLQTHNTLFVIAFMIIMLLFLELVLVSITALYATVPGIELIMRFHSQPRYLSY